MTPAPTTAISSTSHTENPHVMAEDPAMQPKPIVVRRGEEGQCSPSRSAVRLCHARVPRQELQGRG